MFFKHIYSQTVLCSGQSGRRLNFEIGEFWSYPGKWLIPI